MEALILSCSTGGGHNAAANAAAEALNLRGHNVRVLDPYTLVGKHVASAVGGTYVRMVQISPTLFGVVYKLGDTYRKLPIKSPVYAVNRHMAKRLARYFAENKTDVVLCTHVFPAEMLSYMKNSGMNVPKIVFIATDYTCIPFTEETNCDYYATPSPDLNDEYIRCGVRCADITLHSNGTPYFLSSESAPLTTGKSLSEPMITATFFIVQTSFSVKKDKCRIKPHLFSYQYFSGFAQNKSYG